MQNPWCIKWERKCFKISKILIWMNLFGILIQKHSVKGISIKKLMWNVEMKFTKQKLRELSKMEKRSSKDIKLMKIKQILFKNEAMRDNWMVKEEKKFTIIKIVVHNTFTKIWMKAKGKTLIKLGVQPPLNMDLKRISRL